MAAQSILHQWPKLRTIGENAFPVSYPLGNRCSVRRQMSSYRRYPLQVVAGRWGSVDAAEAFYLARGKERLKPVLLALLSSSMKAKKAEPKPATATTDDLLDNVDERAGYNIKMTKYSTGALAAVPSDVFWCLMRLVHTARGPLRHFFLWCQKYARKRPLLRLVTGKADQIQQEFTHLFQSLDIWVDAAINEMHIDLPPTIRTLLRGLCAKLVLTGCGGFEMRIGSMVRKPLDHI